MTAIQGKWGHYLCRMVNLVELPQNWQLMAESMNDVSTEIRTDEEDDGVHHCYGNVTESRDVRWAELSIGELHNPYSNNKARCEPGREQENLHEHLHK